MEVRVRERLIGALVLVAVVVLLVPAILKGRTPAPADSPSPQTRRVEVPIGNEMQAPDEQVLVPEPALPGTAAGAGADLRAPAQAPTVASPPPRPPATAASPPKSAPAATASTEPPTAKPAAAPMAATPAPQPGSAWAVQLGAFSNQAKAEQFVAELKKRRYAAFVLEYRASGKVLYRVRVGPEQERARAEEIAARLAKDGYQPVVARHP
jgi:DedD protein